MDTAASSRSRKALVLLCMAFFLVIMDVAIVGVAAPAIQADLGFSRSALQWVVTAYAITFGGLLLLAGRVADLLGRRRLFIAGAGTFGIASLLAGLSWEPEVLIGARALQGVGAAIIVPAALSIISTTFPEGPERNKALGVWSATAAVGGTAGLIAGGVLTDTAGWEWMFLLNVPVAAGVALLAPVLLDESRAEGLPRSLDASGALAVTGGLALLVFGVVEAPGAGWGSAQTVALLGASALLLGAFGVIEARARAPLAPPRILRSRMVVAGNAIAAAAAAGVFGWFFVATLYLQQVLGYSPLEAGLAFLPLAVGGFVGSIASQALATRYGVRVTVLIGVALVVPGLLLLLSIDPGSEYLSGLLPGFVLFGVGTPFGFTTSLIAGLSEVEDRDAGLASGLVNTSQQIGNGLGVAVLSTVAVARADDLLGSGAGQATALTEGTQAAFLAGLAFPAIAALVALLLVRGARRTGAAVGAPLPAAAGD